jgi:hypothetical protein
MAIVANINIRGLQVNNAYVKLQQVGGSKVYDWAAIYGIYTSKEASSSQTNCLQTIVLKFDFNNGKFIYREAYEIFKRPDFLSHIRSVANVNSIENFDILQTLTYVGDA